MKENILAINCGSSSIKVTLFNQELDPLFNAKFESIHTKSPRLVIDPCAALPFFSPITIPDALEIIFEKMPYPISSIKKIGHRFVHGGSRFSKTVRIDSKIVHELEELICLAPLHNQACLAGIKKTLTWDKGIAQFAVFDTAFHHELPAVAQHYAIPLELEEKYGIKRYGFHGIANAFIWNAYRSLEEGSKIITLHLGNGCSSTAIDHGRSLDTSMGFTPLEGLVMATRSGDIDPSIFEYICRQNKMTSNEVLEILNEKSGLLGLSGISSSMITLLKDPSTEARLAVDLFCYRVVKYIGAYLAVLGGADALIFSGGIGENSPVIRDRIIQKLQWYGIKIDPTINQKTAHLTPGRVIKISDATSCMAIYVVGVDENRFIASELECS